MDTRPHQVEENGKSTLRDLAQQVCAGLMSTHLLSGNASMPLRAAVMLCYLVSLAMAVRWFLLSALGISAIAYMRRLRRRWNSTLPTLRTRLRTTYHDDG